MIAKYFCCFPRFRAKLEEKRKKEEEKRMKEEEKRMKEEKDVSSA